MLKRNAVGPGLSLVLFSLLVVVRVTAQGIPPGSAQTDTGLGGVNTISGMLVSSTGQRIERRVSVRLRSMTRGDRLSTTDDNGNFVFRNVPPGDFIVMIDKEPDFEPLSQNVSVIQPRGMPPQTYYLSLRLNLKGRAETRTGVLNAELANVPPRAVEFYQKALEQAQAGNSKAAIESLKKGISEYPNFMLAFNELGFQYMRLGELEKANDALTKALKISPDAAMPLLNHGVVLALMGKFDLAVVDLQRALDQKEQLANGHLYLGQSLANLGRLDEAAKHLSRAIELGGDDMKDAHRFLGIIYLRHGDRERGVTELETYLKLSPGARDADQIRQVIRQNQKTRND